MCTPATPTGSTLPLMMAMVLFGFKVLVMEGETETTASHPKSKSAVSLGSLADLL